jgi:uncharacterized membrane protein YfcA
MTSPPDLSHVLAAAAAAFLAGGINSVAGGGTLISFPTLVWLGLPSITANATSTLAIWPGSLGSIWGFRHEFRETNPRMRVLSVSSLVGGGIGALLLRSTPTNVFDRLVPFLILFATLLFTVQEPIQKRLRQRGGERHSMDLWLPGALGLNLAVAIYGGYFGAGMSIMMLSSLGILGMTDILQMNALTSLFALCVNGVAAILFIWMRMVDWRYVLPMAVAAVIGGYGAAGVARSIGRPAVRRFVIGVGFVLSALLFFRYFVRIG